MSSMVPDDAPKPRLCQIKKWEGFNGYGFNLHAEKGKAGQYIGKVDPRSPADFAGLKEGDRIVEVNGTNIGNENHGQVVQRIKAVSNETTLLVVDGDADEYYKEKKVVVRGDMPNVVVGKSPDSNPADGGEEIAEVVNNVADRTSSHSSHSDGPESHPHSIRLCHLHIWEGFQGYGFNLHAEKNKPGQYIGKVDDGSPASSAGLREKDRILEVNGLSVVEDNHQGAVTKIKSIPNETKLLVVDPVADEYFKEKGITLGGHVTFISRLEASHTKPEAHVVEVSDTVHPYKPRLVQLETWSDYNGYGFNMHSIKGKTGEYIGKVEHGSPAYVAGLREGDRLLEVSGSSVEHDTHNDVVGKIKAAAGRARLLVVDAETDKYYTERGIVMSGAMPNIVHLDCPATKPQANGTGESSSHEEEYPEPEVPIRRLSNHSDQDLTERPLADAVEEHRDETPPSEPEVREATPEPQVTYIPDPDDDYEKIITEDPPSPSSDADNNNEDKDDEPEIHRDDEPITNEDVPEVNNLSIDRVPTPEPQTIVAPEPQPDIQVKKEVEMRASPTPVPSSPKSPVTLAGIEFAASAEEARKRVSGRKRDTRVSQNLSAKEKYDLFQRL